MEAYALEISGGAFGQSRERFEAMVSWLDGQQAHELTHGELEARLQAEGRELLRALTQDHLDLRAARETRLEQVVVLSGISNADERGLGRQWRCRRCVDLLLGVRARGRRRQVAELVKNRADEHDNGPLA